MLVSVRVMDSREVGCALGGWSMPSSLLFQQGDLLMFVVAVYLGKLVAVLAWKVPCWV